MINVLSFSRFFLAHRVSFFGHIARYASSSVITLHSKISVEQDKVN